MTITEQVNVIYNCIGEDNQKLYDDLIIFVKAINQYNIIVDPENKTGPIADAMISTYNPDLPAAGKKHISMYYDENITGLPDGVIAGVGGLIRDSVMEDMLMDILYNTTERDFSDKIILSPSPRSYDKLNLPVEDDTYLSSFDFDEYYKNKNKYVEIEEEYDAFGNKITSKDKSDDSEIEYIDVVAGNDSMNRAGDNSERLTFRNGKIVREDPNSINRAGAYD